MIAGLLCSETMLEALLSLPHHSYRRIETALQSAFACPESIDDHRSIRGEEIELHLIVAHDILFVIGDSASQVRLLQVTLFRPEGEPHTIH